MNKFFAIFHDTFLQIKNTKMFYIFGIIMILMILILALIVLAVPSMEIEGQKIFDNDAFGQGIAYEAFSYLFRYTIGFYILLMAFMTAWLIPSYLDKGRVELTLSKPINRPNLILMKFASVYLQLTMLLTAIIVVLWLAFSIATGTFIFEIFYGLLLSYFQIFIIYSLIFSMGLIGNSGVLAIIGYFIINYAQWITSSPMGFFYVILKDSALEKVMDITHHILPKMAGISDSVQSLLGGNGVNDFYDIWSSFLFSLVIIMVSVFIFKKRDY